MSNTICATVVRIVCSVCKPSFVKCTRGLGGGAEPQRTLGTTDSKVQTHLRSCSRKLHSVLDLTSDKVEEDTTTPVKRLATGPASGRV